MATPVSSRSAGCGTTDASSADRKTGHVTTTRTIGSAPATISVQPAPTESTSTAAATGPAASAAAMAASSRPKTLLRRSFGHGPLEEREAGSVEGRLADPRDCERDDDEHEVRHDAGGQDPTTPGDQARREGRCEPSAADKAECHGPADEPAKPNCRRQHANPRVSDPQQVERGRDEGDVEDPADEALAREQQHDQSRVGHRQQRPHRLQHRTLMRLPCAFPSSERRSRGNVRRGLDREHDAERHDHHDRPRNERRRNIAGDQDQRRAARSEDGSQGVAGRCHHVRRNQLLGRPSQGRRERGAERSEEAAGDRVDPREEVDREQERIADDQRRCDDKARHPGRDDEPEQPVAGDRVGRGEQHRDEDDRRQRPDDRQERYRRGAPGLVRKDGQPDNVHQVGGTKRQRPKLEPEEAGVGRNLTKRVERRSEAGSKARSAPEQDGGLGQASHGPDRGGWPIQPFAAGVG